MTHTQRAQPSFEDVFTRVTKAGEVAVTSRKGTNYRVTAIVAQDGVRTLGARPENGGQARVHEDCWGEPKTCHGTWAGGVYHGSPSLMHMA